MEQTTSFVRREGSAVGAVARLGLHVIVPLSCGSAVYLCFRPTGLGVFEWIRHAGLSDPVFALRAFAAPARSHLPGWFVYSLPDGLWCYAMTAASTLLWQDACDRSALRRLSAHLGLAAACGLELLQHTGALDGTADPMDVLLACVGAIAARGAIDETWFQHHRPAEAGRHRNSLSRRPQWRLAPDAVDRFDSGSNRLHDHGGRGRRKGAIR
ncbi:MAG: hypothetical protein ABI818_05360 [Acidobacteriota bacterium]